MTKRNCNSPQFKAKVALEALTCSASRSVS